MGKRRRSGKQKRPASATDGDSAPAVDEDTVHYASDSEDDLQRPSASVRAAEQSGSDSDSDEDSSDAELQMGGVAPGESDIEVDLEFFDPTQADVTPLAVFLKKFAALFTHVAKKDGGKKGMELSERELAKTVCEQTRVGTVIRVAEDGGPIGFISVLNLRSYRRLLSPVTKRLQKLCEERKHPDFARLLRWAVEEDSESSSKKVGLILCERVVNLPPQIIPKMLEALFCEIKWATEDEETEEERESYRFDYFLYITEVFERCDDAQGGGKAEKKEGASAENAPPAKKQKGTLKDADESLRGVSFTRVEDEVWLSHATQSVSWHVRVGDEAAVVGRKQLAMIVPSNRIEDVRRAVSKLVGMPVEDAG